MSITQISPKRDSPDYDRLLDPMVIDLEPASKIFKEDMQDTNNFGNIKNNNVEQEKKDNTNSINTSTLLITNLKRPLRNESLKELLSTYGMISKFWIDKIKTHCYVQVF